MEIDEIKQMIEAGLAGCEAIVVGDGRHFEATVISDQFDGKTPIQKQRLVMETVKAELQSDKLHALSIKTFTTAQWAEQG